MADLLPANSSDSDVIAYLKARGVPNPRIARSSAGITILWDGGKIVYSFSNPDHGLTSASALIPETHLYSVVVQAAPANIATVAHLAAGKAATPAAQITQAKVIAAAGIHK